MTLIFPAVEIEGEIHAQSIKVTPTADAVRLCLERKGREGEIEMTLDEAHELAQAIWQPIPEEPGNRYPDELYSLRRVLSVQVCGRIEFPHSHVFFSDRASFKWCYLDRANVERLAVALFNLRVYGDDDETKH